MVFSKLHEQNHRAGETSGSGEGDGQVFFAMVPVLAPVFEMAYPYTSMSSLHREGSLERYPMLHTGYSNITTSFGSLS